MTIKYEVNRDISAQQFISVLNRSTLGERRPVDDLNCIQGMLDGADILITAWDQACLVGVARSVSDLHYACYLSDLAVDSDYQKLGIGKQLQVMTQAQLGPQCSLILIAAPKANNYYEHIGMVNNPRCWLLPPGQSFK
ncbi:GNAT family N-acetyltransferase [Marinicella sp. W31]|uniref:GNAT family N-acetyltransferase n=1 Tax=Marinicella sp. W31 TaxID=3023713 RepID=UPI003757837F